ncbi:Protein VMS1 [Wickerhamiella sorbophila]|uniref:Protein VMS1 n=1 Tax=Wickerhamiella sorbophila TaxID=45607 RepID=A0A2T0FFB3_9ASCO|nr:Protein VMS1 [Wickerhamiella sorbophila]PRT53649.1 Protein VMS1 [Wickerhamiella sorbophila]
MSLTQKSLYIFDLPASLVSTLSPFRTVSAYDSSSESESDDNEFSDSSDSSDEEGFTPSASHMTQYKEEYEDFDHWKMVNLAHISGSSFVYFTSSLIPPGKVLSVYKSVLDKDMIIDRPVDSLTQLKPDGKSAVLLVGAGHFAGAIFSHVRGKHKTNISNPFANINVLASKSFHRYTTRRKQGGAQGASDNAKGKAKSAGSNMRRQGELALKQEVQQLLESWAPELKDCQKIYIRASGSRNKALIMGYPKAPIPAKDVRVASIPFVTKRPTYDETRRVWLQITKAQVVDQPQVELTPTPEPATKVTVKESKPESAKPVVDPEVEATKVIVEHIKKSRLGPLKQELESKGSLDFTLQPASKYKPYPTALLLATALDKYRVVTGLLEWGADPTIKATGGKTIWDIAGNSKKTKDALQIARHDLGDDKWDWSATKIGPAMSKEDILACDTAEKLQIKEKLEKKLQKEEEQKKKQRLERLIAKHGSGRYVGGDNLGTNGLSEQEKQYIERERRARAAEARLARFAKK